MVIKNYTLYIHKFIFHTFPKNDHYKKNGKEHNVLFWNEKERNALIGKERSVPNLIFKRPIYLIIFPEK